MPLYGVLPRSSACGIRSNTFMMYKCPFFKNSAALGPVEQRNSLPFVSKRLVLQESTKTHLRCSGDKGSGKKGDLLAGKMNLQCCEPGIFHGH